MWIVQAQATCQLIFPIQTLYLCTGLSVFLGFFVETTGWHDYLYCKWMYEHFKHNENKVTEKKKENIRHQSHQSLTITLKVQYVR